MFFKQVSSDLVAYCRHAHRTTIELADVELLMKRFALELYVCYIYLTLSCVCLHIYRWHLRMYQKCKIAFDQFQTLRVENAMRSRAF